MNASDSLVEASAIDQLAGGLLTALGQLACEDSQLPQGIKNSHQTNDDDSCRTPPAPSSSPVLWANLHDRTDSSVIGSSPQRPGCVIGSPPQSTSFVIGSPPQRPSSAPPPALQPIVPMLAPIYHESKPQQEWSLFQSSSNSFLNSDYASCFDSQAGFNSNSNPVTTSSYLLQSSNSAFLNNNFVSHVVAPVDIGRARTLSTSSHGGSSRNKLNPSILSSSSPQWVSNPFRPSCVFNVAAVKPKTPKKVRFVDKPSKLQTIGKHKSSSSSSIDALALASLPLTKKKAVIRKSKLAFLGVKYCAEKRDNSSNVLEIAADITPAFQKTKAKTSTSKQSSDQHNMWLSRVQIDKTSGDQPNSKLFLKKNIVSSNTQGLETFTTCVSTNKNVRPVFPSAISTVSKQLFAQHGSKHRGGSSINNSSNNSTNTSANNSNGSSSNTTKSRRVLYKLRERRKRVVVADSDLPNLTQLSLGDAIMPNINPQQNYPPQSCSQEARFTSSNRNSFDAKVSPSVMGGASIPSQPQPPQQRSDADDSITMEELAAYIDNHLYFPKKMSFMAEMMYT